MRAASGFAFKMPETKQFICLMGLLAFLMQQDTLDGIFHGPEIGNSCDIGYGHRGDRR